MILGTIFLGLGVYMAPALWRITPQGTVGEGLVAFLPLDTKPSAGESTAGQPALDWGRDFAAAWKQATESNKDIFIDFTGVYCTNCRANEKNVFVLPEVRKELEKYIRVQLYTDSVPDPKLDRNAATAQADRNRDLLAATFGDVSNPLYAIIKPRKGEQPFVTDGNGVSKINGANRKWIRKGLIPNDKIQDFENFLRNPQPIQMPWFAATSHEQDDQRPLPWPSGFTQDVPYAFSLRALLGQTGKQSKRSARIPRSSFILHPFSRNGLHCAPAHTQPPGHDGPLCKKGPCFFEDAQNVLAHLRLK
jgi:hypothetical protein